MRNNSGAFFNANGRLVRFGLGAESAHLVKIMKSSDLIGIAPGGRFMAIECKHPQWKWTGNERERAQFVFIMHVLLRGGIAGFVRSAEELEALVRETQAPWSMYGEKLR